MNFRLGYVAMSLKLEDASPSGTVTVTNFSRLPGEEARLYRLRRITRKNLENTLRILRYNAAYNIKVYRLTSKLIPLATHPMTEAWDYAADFSDEFRRIGDFVKENGLRVSAHPDHFTLINSSSERILSESVKDLDYHVRVYEAMGLEDYRYKLVLHVGGLYKNKAGSLERFKENFAGLPDRIKNRIILENDDKCYSAADVLGICRELGIPMVLDVHHHKCLDGGYGLEELLPDIFDTWKGEFFTPKVHFSSPRSCKDYRSHADDINPEDFLEFIKLAGPVGRDFDIMLEAKKKDLTLLELSEKLERVDWLKKINEGEFQVN